MKNSERYKKAFSKFQTSRDYLMEVENMKNNGSARKFYVSKLAAVCVALVLVLGASTAVYAVNVGGIQRIIQVWMHGDQTNAVINVDDGTYSASYTDKDGKERTQSGGGVAFDENGNEVPVSEEDLIEYLNMPDIEYTDEGKVLVYYRDHIIDITDKFEDDVCYLQLVHEGEILYMTVKYKNGYSTGRDKYPLPSEFNTSVPE